MRDIFKKTLLTLLLMACPVSANIPRSDIVRDRCDFQEYNSFYDDQGRPVFDQIIYWNFCDDKHTKNIYCMGREVFDWRLVKSESMIPRYDKDNGKFVALFHDFKMRDILREVTSDYYIRSHTMYDPELHDRNIHRPEGKRGKLSESVCKKESKPTPVHEVQIEQP